ncbi:MAG: discoidin domain-containing protein [Kiritimatiellae bacterium]|nr:discoidin domain-containing protein [Kiritimatiellia bacterium]
MKKIRIGLLSTLALAAAFSAGAALNAPKEWAHGFINGYFSLIAYTESGNRIEVQMKDQGADDSAYQTVYLGAGVHQQWSYTGGFANGTDYSTTFPDMPGPLRAHKFATNVYSTVTCRMRAENGGDYSDWVDLGDSTGYPRASGTWIGYQNGNRIYDGDLETMYDHDTALWVGMDFGRKIKVRGIRYYSRSDATYSRIYNTRFEYASDASFSDAVTAFEISKTNNSDRRNIVELWFDEPVETRYIRHVSSASGRCSICELEFIPAENPYLPTLTPDGYSDEATLYPQMTWRTPAEAVPVRGRVLRATSATGTYEPVTDWSEGGSGSFTDVNTTVGVQYFYKAEVECAHPSFSDAGCVNVVVSDAVPMYRLRRLDRDPVDETRLLPGVSLMACTNGSVNATMARAFDGQENTWPDSIDFYYGPVGLKFAKKTWVARFGYVCRPTQAARMKMVALFSADADDTRLDNKVQRSPRPTAEQVSAEPTMFFLDADSLPAEGADQYFLWKCDNLNETFHGNVAELRFYGWDEDDVAKAGVVTPPTEITFVRQDDGIAVAWNAGSSAVTGYGLQRRSRGVSEWTDVTETSVDVRTYVDTGLTDGVYEYRVVAKGADDQTVASAPFTAVFYTAGSGTGLRSVIYSPFKAMDPELCAPDACHDRDVEAPNLEFAAEDEFAPGVVNNAYSVMTGSLIVPFTGSYTFRLDTANGGAVFIDDGLWALNAWCSGEKTGEIQLTAGVHAIEIHTRLEDAANRVKLYWSGTVSEELVPASQLVPAEVPFSLDYAKGWKARFYGGDNLGSVKANADGAVVIRAGNLNAVNWRTNPKTVFYAHACTRAFTLTAHAKDLMTGSGNYGLMVRAGNGNFVRFYCANSSTGYADYKMSVLKEGDTAYTLVKGETGPERERTENMVCDMQLVYNDQTGEFIASYRNPSSAVWVEFARWANDGSIYGPFEVGCFVGGGYSGHAYGEVAFSEIDFKPVKGTLIMLK